MTAPHPAPLVAEISVSPAEADRRIIPPSDFRADTEAFIDVRIPGSAGKASYSFIGPGVSQNAAQSVNLSEPHGFNVGAASMPTGVVNNQHMHYTAEVFVCTRGRWEMRLGQHGEQRVEIGPGTVFSAPTWIFRGFRNVGDDDGWLYAVLGGDDTGGILWAPEVLEAAAATGLRLTEDDAVIESEDHDSGTETIGPVDQRLLTELDCYSDEEIAERIVGPDRLQWSDRSLLSHALPGHHTRMAPVIGHGMTEDRHHRPPILNPHGFTLEWLELAPGARIGQHRVERPQAVIAIAGDLEVTFNRGDAGLTRPVPEGAIASMPAGSWRDLVNPGAQPARCIVVCSGDGPTRADWDPAIVEGASANGRARDASGYLAPLALLGRSRA